MVVIMRHIHSCLLGPRGESGTSSRTTPGCSFVGCSFLSDDQQSHIGNDIEDQKENFEQPEERVDDHVEGFSGNGKPFALSAIH